MKKKSFLFTLLIQFGTLLTLFQQSRFPIQPTSVWRINYEVMSYDTSHHHTGDEIFRFFIDGDTTINSKQFYKLFKSGTAYYDPAFYYDHTYAGAVRDENNRYYYLEKNHSMEVVLYDFDINTGDTVQTSIETGMVVKSVEVLENGRKKINILKTDFQHGKCLNWNNSFFIEGIGSMGGLLFENPCNHVGFRENYLVCYTENGQLVYQSSLSPKNCDIANTNRIAFREIKDIRLYPIPAKDHLTVEWTDASYQMSSVEAYDVLGKKVSNLKIIKTSPHNISLDINNLENGIYFLILKGADFSVIRKCIIREN
jgi:hypothetical protein